MGSPLVIFDCDGVLVDSEALVVHLEAEMLTTAGFPIAAEQILRRFTGLSYDSMLSAIGEDFGRPVPPAVGDGILRESMALFPARLEAVPGISDVLERLAQPRCVASSSDLERIELSLRVCDLARHFAPESLFSAEMVENGKPAPDLFLLAADGMGVAPEECLVIEDSPPGVQAACAAGMKAVGLVAGGHVQPGLDRRLEEAGAAQVFRTAAELGRYLRALA